MLNLQQLPSAKAGKICKVEKESYGGVELQKLSFPEVHVLKNKVNATHLKKLITASSDGLKKKKLMGK